MPRPCAPDRTALLTRAAAAFVDRGAIDWTRLSARAATPDDRAALESLRLLDTLRNPDAHAEHVSAPERATARLVAALTLLAALQTAACLLVVAFAAWQGADIWRRGTQIALTAAFAAAAAIVFTVARLQPAGALLTAGYLATASAFARATLPALPTGDTAAIVPLLRGLYPEAFLPALLWDLSTRLPASTRFAKFDSCLAPMVRLAWLAGAILFVVNVAAAYGLVDEQSVRHLLRSHPGHGFWSVFAILAAPPLGIILWRAVRAPRRERQRVLRLATSMAAGTGPLLLLGVARVAVPPFEAWLHSAPASHRAWLDLVVLGAFTTTPVLASIALGMDRPLELVTRLTPTFRTRLHQAISGILVPTMIVVLAETQRRTGGAWLSSPWSWIVVVGFALMLVLVVRVGRAAGRTREIVDALDRVRRARTRAELAATLAGEAARATGARFAAVLQRDGRGTFADPLDRLRPLDAGSGIAAALRTLTNPMPLTSDEDAFHLLPALDRRWCEAGRVELAMPVRRADQSMTGILILGPPESGRAYTRHHRWIVATLANAATAAPANTAALSATSASAGDRVGTGDGALECPTCGLLFDVLRGPCNCGSTPVPALLPSLLAGKFLVRRRLGRGGMGVAYLATDTSLSRDVVLKTLPRVSQVAVERLLIEARTMAAVRHAGVATLFGVEMWRDTPVLIVEHLSGGTLADRLVRGPLTEADLTDLALAMVDALAHLHARGIVHGDVKPQNVAFSAGGLPVLLDFGLATLATAAGGDAPEFACAGGPAAGTRRYMPPEVLAGGSVTPASDWWALGVMLRESCAAPIPPEWCTFFARALVEDPAQRLRNGQAWREMIPRVRTVE